MTRLFPLVKSPNELQMYSANCLSVISLSLHSETSDKITDSGFGKYFPASNSQNGQIGLSIVIQFIFTSSFQRTREVAQRYGALDFLEPIRVAFRLIRFSMIAAIDKMFMFALVNYFVDANIRNIIDISKYFVSNKNIKPIVTNEAELVTEIITKRVPLVNQYAYAGYLTGYQDQEYIDQLPTVLFDVDHDPKGNYLAFEVKGDSMNDGSDESYKDGDRLLCREIPSHLWCNSKLHLRKWDFVIVHKEGVLVKRIVDHDVQNHTITIHSLNPFYEDQVIDLVDVYQIFNVIEYQRKTRR